MSAYGETPGGLQAPHVIRQADRYLMFYGDWQHICLAESTDGKTFTRVLQANGRPQLFGEDPDANTRDPMVLEIGDEYYCYYTAFPERKGSVFCRRSKDLKTWTDVATVAFGGSAGENPFSAECPFVVRYEPTESYYLFRTQRYGQNAQTSVYCSRSALDFGVNDDKYLVGRLAVAAPEIIFHEGQWYIASLLPSLKGIQIAKLEWK